MSSRWGLLTQPFLSVRQVDVTYPTPAGPVRALVEANLEVARGEVVCVFGASGSGKSTLLEVIGGLQLPTSGVVTVGGNTVSDMDERQRTRLRLSKVGMVFQEHNLVSQFTASENIQIVLRAQGHATPKAEASRLLQLVGVEELADRSPVLMSGGQRQRVGIARGLAGARPLLLCDEPTGALDRENSRQLFQHLRSIAHEDQVACVIATHDPLAEEYADRILHMVDGRLV